MSDKWEIVALPQGDEIMKNGKVASTDEAERILNYHHRLREALDRMVRAEDCSRDAPGILFDAAEAARALLAELDNLEKES